MHSQLRGSFFIWFHFCSPYMIYFIYIYHFHGNISSGEWEMRWRCLYLVTKQDKLSYTIWQVIRHDLSDNQLELLHAQPPLGSWLRTLQCEWISTLLRTLSIWFLLDHNALRFSLHLAESVLKEIQKTKKCKAVWLFFFFNLFLVARLRFSLVYLCV